MITLLLMHYQFNKTQPGFTLIELMITLVIAGILVSAGIPSMRHMMEDNRASSYTNEFMSALYLTRSEAVKRGTRVTLCRSANGTSCSTSGTWQVGWVIFEDNNNDGVFVAADVIQIYDALPSTVIFTSAGATSTYVSFIEDGSAQKNNGSAQAGVMTLSSGGESRTITLTSVGRFSVSDTST